MQIKKVSINVKIQFRCKEELTDWCQQFDSIQNENTTFNLRIRPK